MVSGPPPPSSSGVTMPRPAAKASSRPPKSFAIPPVGSAASVVFEWAKIICNEANDQLGKSTPSMSLEEGSASELCGAVERRLGAILTDAQHRRLGRKGESLSAEDVNGTLESRGLDVSLGSWTPPQRKLPSREVDLKQRSQMPLPAPPAEPSLALHWLAVEGSAPEVAENESSPSAAAAPKKKIMDVASREHELYIRKVVETIEDDALDDGERREVFWSLRTSDGVAGLTPAIVAFCTNLASKAKKKSTRSLRSAVAALRALCLNRRAGVEPVLHDVLPAALTFVVAKKLGNDDDHLLLRTQAARCVADVCDEYGDAYASLRPRVAKTLVDALTDNSKPLATRYGALVAIDALGPLAIKTLLVPQAPRIVEHLQNLRSSRDENGDKGGEDPDLEACYSALVQAVATYAKHSQLIGSRPIAPFKSITTSRRFSHAKQQQLLSGKKRPHPHSSSSAADISSSYNRCRGGGKDGATTSSSSRLSHSLLQAFGESLVPFAGDPHGLISVVFM